MIGFRGRCGRHRARAVRRRTPSPIAFRTWSPTRMQPRPTPRGRQRSCEPRRRAEVEAGQRPEHERAPVRPRPGEAQGPGHAAPPPGRDEHDRPAAARHPRAHRLGARRPMAGAAHPVGVRRGLRRPGRARSRGQRLRLRADAERTRRTTPSRWSRQAPRRGGLRRDHRRRPRLDGGRQPRCVRGRRRVGRPRHRAALRAGHERVGRHRRRLPLFLRPQDDVRQVRPGFRRAARRLRHLRRAVRGAGARADPQGHVVPGGAARHGLLVGSARLAAPGRPARRQDRRTRPRALHADR